MKIRDFAKRITEAEGLKVSLSIAQVLEVLKLINKEMGGNFYKVIRLL